MDIWVIFAALFLTLIVEVPIAALFRCERKFLFAVALANVITNPLLTCLLYFNALVNLLPQSLALILVLETIVVLAEAGLLVWARAGNRKDMLKLSFVMNACSFVIGILISGLPFSRII